MTKEKKEKCDQLFATFLFKCNLPFNIVENEHLKKFVSELKPSYKIPSRRTTTEVLLPKLYTKASEKIGTINNREIYLQIQQSNENKLKNADVITLVLDGWTNVRNESIVNVIACIPQPIFLKSLPTGANRHTAENMFKLIEPTIDELGKPLERYRED